MLFLHKFFKIAVRYEVFGIKENLDRQGMFLRSPRETTRFVVFAYHGFDFLGSTPRKSGNSSGNAE